MARWKPPDIVGLNEYIGRRIFTREELAGAAGQPKPAELYEIVHFEPGEDDEISLDRLGRSSVEPKVVHNYLEARGLFAATRMHKRAFLGWAVARARNLINSPRPEFPNLPIHASPLPSDGVDELTENIYHAHIMRPGEIDDYYTALHVREIFLRHNHFEAVRGAEPGEPRALYSRVCDWIMRGWQRWRG